MKNDTTELTNQVQTLKRMIYGLAFLLIAVVVITTNSLQNIPDVIQANKFEVLNQDGDVVASLYYDMGGGMLSLSSKDGHVVAGLGSDEVNGGGVLGINNNHGKVIARIYSGEDGGTMHILSNDFLELAGLFANAGGGTLKTFNSKGEPTFSIPTQSH
jgi:hypothetical protein